jgi:2-dehydropantoate 2-reductase
MRVVVMGSGGVGGYYGGRLAAAGEEVTFIARGAHLAAIQRDGLHVKSVAGDFHVRPKATDDPSTIGVVDLVLFAVKGYDTETAAERVRPLVGPQTTVLCVQNGVDNEEKLERILGKSHILAGVVRSEERRVGKGV